MSNLLLKTGRGTFNIVSMNDIIYIERLKGKSRIFLKNNNLRVNIPFADLYEQLDDNFSQCHRKYLVNLSYVKKFTNRSVLFERNVMVPIGLHFKNQFIHKMMNHTDHHLIRKTI
jgi:DNA-binding LytR/AlgR family response regulator